jgi:hypothetical protein
MLICLADLIPTLLSLSTTHLPYATLVTSFQQVCIYVSRFKTRLSPVNMLHLKRLVVFLDALKKYVEEWRDARAKEKEKTEVMSVSQLTERMGRRVSGINLLEIESYLKRSKVCIQMPYKLLIVVLTLFRSLGKLQDTPTSRQKRKLVSHFQRTGHVTL